MSTDSFNAGVRRARSAVLTALHPDDAAPMLSAIAEIEAAFINRVSELLEANNREVERRRVVEQERDDLRADLTALRAQEPQRAAQD